jgi:hypothetical protein
MKEFLARVGFITPPRSHPSSIDLKQILNLFKTLQETAQSYHLAPRNYPTWSNTFVEKVPRIFRAELGNIMD